MKYQGFVTEEKDPDAFLGAVFRCYYVPVEKRDGAWFAAGPAQTDVETDQRFILSRVMHYQIFRPDADIGSLDDIVSPDGHTVVARYWLPDDYTPPTEEELRRREEEARRKYREIMGDKE